MGYISWDEYYALAKEVYETMGTINVPARFEYKGYPLGDWISRQRGIERKNGLKPIRKTKLDALGVEWDGRQIKADSNHQKFLVMYSLLKAYKDKFGDTRVPRTYLVGDCDLGSWASSVRESLRGKGRRKITAEQKDLLDEIGFEINWYQENVEASWKTHFSLVVEYANQNGIDEIIQSTTYKGKNIGNWVHIQRMAYKDGTLSSDRYERLREIGLDFAPAAGRWEKAFSLAELFYTEFHNLDVPNDFILKEFNLGRWISNQRQIYKGTRTDMILTEEQIHRLESIGMIWKTSGHSNTSFLEQAFLFYIKQLHPDTITRDISHGIELDIYVPSINFALEYDGSYWHKGKLAKDNQKDAACLDVGIRLVRIRENPLPNTASAICYPTVSRHSNTSLAYLISKVINEQLGGIIDVDITRDAFAIIKDFEHFSGRSWHRYFVEAEQYWTEHGNLMIPVSYVSPNGIKLGVWIQNQRSAYKGTTYGHLSVKEVQMLESIGMVWDVREHTWLHNYHIAKAYFEEHGNLLVSRECVYRGVKLGRWINGQRNAYNRVGRRSLSAERTEKLEAIGMVWNTKQQKKA